METRGSGTGSGDGSELQQRCRQRGLQRWRHVERGLQQQHHHRELQQQLSARPAPPTTAPSAAPSEPTGGSVSRLGLRRVGDTRPANEDDPSGYPTAIITKIYEDIEAQSPHPVLTLATGDYQFSSTGSNSTASQQVPLYAAAIKHYSGLVFPAMGNHECGVSGSASGSTDNNCGPGNPGGATPNYNAFMTDLLAPIGKTNPYYSINVNAQRQPVDREVRHHRRQRVGQRPEQLAGDHAGQTTTYTFVVRHEASDADPPPAAPERAPTRRASRGSTRCSRSTPTRCSSSDTPTTTVTGSTPRQSRR